MIRRYEDIIAYQKSYEMALRIHKRTKQFPREELYGITDQIRRASMSVPLNIAEGYGKKESAAEFKRFLVMGKGSCNEVTVLIRFCRDLGYLEQAESEEMEATYIEIGKMLYGLHKNWETLTSNI